MPASAHKLPVELTSFVGRRRELAEADRLLAQSRLLTLIGVGGVGKTRLAVELARRGLRRFDHGAFFVDLAAYSDPRMVANVVAAAVGAIEHLERPVEDALVAQFADRRVLLLLDNCERLVDGCAQLTHLILGRCPGVTVLATSREPLRVAGEQTWTVRPLSRRDARDLLIERMRLSRPDLVVARETEEQIATLCTQLDCVPLALELAAARLRTLGLEDLLARLACRLDLLDAGPRTAVARQRTMRATIEWSYDLLEEPEQVLFRRLAVFVGGFRLDDAEAVCAGEPIAGTDVARLVGRLAERSLLLVEARRYRLLETIREYARERLVESGELAAYEHRHAECFRALAETADAEQRCREQATWSDRLSCEHDNLRAALAHTRHADADAHLRLAVALGWFWTVHGHYAEARSELRAAVAACGGSSRVRGRALVWLGTLVRLKGELEASRAMIADGLALLRALGERDSTAFALQTLGVSLTAVGDVAAARSAFEESVAIYASLNEAWGVATSRLHLGRTAMREGDLRAAKALIVESAAALRELEDGAYAAEALLSLGVLARLEGDDSHAEEILRDALALARRAGSRLGMPTALEGLAAVAASRGQAERALRLVGAAGALRDAIGLRPPPWWPGLVAAWLRPARDAVGPVVARAHEARGRGMRLEEAIAYALAETASGELTSRELVVAELVGEGLTNREIAARLVVSVRTAEGHVERIRSKLGFRTRGEIAAWRAASR